MLRRHIILLIAIRPYDGDVSPLGAFREEQAMSQHRVSPSPFLSSSSHTTQLHYTNSYTDNHPNLNFLPYTIQTLVPHVMWSAQAVRELKIDHTQRHLSTLRGCLNIFTLYLQHYSQFHKFVLNLSIKVFGNNFCSEHIQRVGLKAQPSYF